MAESSSTSRREHIVKLFPRASQPSIIRASQKDELYLQFLVDSCHDVVRRLLGPRRALLWAQETKALAELLFYSLTTGTGAQTLGEEYCDILQVTGRLGGAPGSAQRGMLVLLQVLGPYLAERLAPPQDDGLAAWQAARWQQQQRQQQQHGGQQQAALWLVLWQRAQDAARQLRHLVQNVAQPLVRRFPRAALFLQDHWPSLMRLHLALFYLYGYYYQPSKRVTGVRYLFLGRTFEGRPSYHVLGLLLCAQIGVSAGLWVLRNYGATLPLPGIAGSIQHAKLRHAVLLDEDGQEVAASSSGHAAAASSQDGSLADVPTARKCPLCLSARDCPTATPCGHVFCWQCIAEWCNQKAECPLCRAEVLPALLVPVACADF